MSIDIRLYQTAALTELYSQDGTFTDPIFDKSTYVWDGDLGQSRDVQIWVRNDGLDDAFDITVRPVDIDGTSQAGWAKVAANQGALAAAIPAESYTVGNLAAGASSNFWLRVRVPAATDPELKVDLRLRSIGSWSSSSSSSSSCSSNSSVSSSSESVSSLSSSSSSSCSSISSQSSSSSTSAGVGSDIKIAYGTNNQAITITANSLANTAARESDSIVNSSNEFLDALVGLTIKTGAAPSATGYAVILAYGTSDGGTTFTGGATGSDAAITVEITLKVIKVVPVTNVANTQYEIGPLSIAAAFGGHLPDEWGIVIANQTGDALNVANNAAWYQGIYRTLQ